MDVAVIFSNTYLNIYLYLPAAIGALGSGEVGIAEELFGNDGMAFIGGCYGFKTDVSVGAEINLGFWRHLNDIPGESFAVGLGFDVPFTEIGAGATLVFNSPDEELVGVVISFGIPGLGFGLSSVDMSYAACKTPYYLEYKAY